MNRLAILFGSVRTSTIQTACCSLRSGIARKRLPDRTCKLRTCKRSYSVRRDFLPGSRSSGSGTSSPQHPECFLTFALQVRRPATFIHRDHFGSRERNAHEGICLHCHRLLTNLLANRG